MAKAVSGREIPKVGVAPWSWAALDTMRVGRWGEQYFGMALTKAGMDVYQPFVDDRSIDLLVRIASDRVRSAELHIKTIWLSERSRSSYVFLKKRLFPLSPLRYFGLVVLQEGSEEPDLYLMPSELWSSATAPFVSRDYVDRGSEPEYGLTVSRSNISKLVRFRLAEQLSILGGQLARPECLATLCISGAEISMSLRK
jgi:hypothetical protein